MDELKEFQCILEQYANAYKAFEEMQNKISFIPRKGDQKTGVIGEAYVFKYLIECGYADVEFGNASSNSGIYDIEKMQKAKSMKQFKLKPYLTIQMDIFHIYDLDLIYYI